MYHNKINNNKESYKRNHSIHQLRSNPHAVSLNTPKLVKMHINVCEMKKLIKSRNSS